MEKCSTDKADGVQFLSILFESLLCTSFALSVAKPTLAITSLVVGQARLWQCLLAKAPDKKNAITAAPS